MHSKNPSLQISPNFINKYSSTTNNFAQTLQPKQVSTQRILYNTMSKSPPPILLNSRSITPTHSQKVLRPGPSFQQPRTVITPVQSNNKPPPQYIYSTRVNIKR